MGACAASPSSRSSTPLSAISLRCGEAPRREEIKLKLYGATLVEVGL